MADIELKPIVPPPAPPDTSRPILRNVMREWSRSGPANDGSYINYDFYSDPEWSPRRPALVLLRGGGKKSRKRRARLRPA